MIIIQKLPYFVFSYLILEIRKGRNQKNKNEHTKSAIMVVLKCEFIAIWGFNTNRSGSDRCHLQHIYCFS